MVDFLAKRLIRDYENVGDKKVRSAYGTLTAVVGVIVNLLLAGAKLVFGLLSGSVSIVADAVNNLSDAGSSVISFVCFKISGKPADRDHPYGHARIEYVTSMVVAMLVLLVGAELLKSSVDGLIHPAVNEVTVWTAVVLFVAILGKIWLAAFNVQVGKKIKSDVMTATAADSYSDAASTGAVFVGVLVTLLFPEWVGTPYVDAAIGVIVSVLILIAGLQILNETKNRILGEAPDEETVAALLSIVRAHSDVLGVHDLSVHEYGPGNTVASLHAEVDGTRDMFDVHDGIDNIEMEVYRELGIVLTIHTDPISTDADTTRLRAETLKTVQSVDERLDIHDFRMVGGATHSNLIFDIRAPFECKLSDDEIAARVQEKIHAKDAHYYAVVHIDRA